MHSGLVTLCIAHNNEVFFGAVISFVHTELFQKTAAPMRRSGAVVMKPQKALELEQCYAEALHAVAGYFRLRLKKISGDEFRAIMWNSNFKQGTANRFSRTVAVLPCFVRCF